MSQVVPFFVYGTLLPRQPNYSIWEHAVNRVRPATFAHGLLYDMGNYPMLIEGDGVVINGAIIDIDPQQYAAVLVAIDKLETYSADNPEESMYLRVKRTFTLQNGTEEEAWVYVGKPHYVQGLMPCGNDWVRYSAETIGTMHDWWTTFHKNPTQTLFDEE